MIVRGVHELVASAVRSVATASQVGPLPEAGPTFEPLEASLALVLGVVVGTAALAVSAGYLRDRPEVGTALVTALLGGLVVGLIGWLIEPVVVAVPLAIAAWVAVLRYQYGGDWLDAAAVGAGAWVVALIVGTVLGLLGLPVTVVGVPGL